MTSFLINLQRHLTTPVAKTPRWQLWVWLGLSLAIALIFGLQAVQYGFSSEYIVQDDARQHVFWMQRFINPQLFPQDWIADYFQLMASPGYTFIYRMAAELGIEPFTFNKILPLVLGLIATGYGFGVAIEILPIPAAGFAAALVLNQTLWTEDDLISATPRAFLYPLFLAFCYYLLRQSSRAPGQRLKKTSRWRPSQLFCLLLLGLQGLFYPPFALVSLGILTLRLWRRSEKGWRLSQQPTDYWLWGAGVLVVALVLLPYELADNPFGPMITPGQARLQLEFQRVGGEYGRAFFFDKNPLFFWLLGPRSGLLPELPSLALAPLTLLGFASPFVLGRPAQFPLARQVTPKISLLVQTLLVSLGLFLAAHLLLFRLHFPGRYPYHSLRIVLPLAAGIVLVLALEAILRSFNDGGVSRPRLIRLGLSGLLAAILILGPFFLTVGNQGQIVGNVPRLYEFLRRQPPETLVASVAEEVNNLPSFAARPILVGREYALPYHTRYYAEIRQRTVDLIEAQYSPDLETVKGLIEKYEVDFMLLDAAAFTPDYVADHEWMQQFQPVTTTAERRLQQGQIPALAGLMERCAAFKTKDLVLLEAQCIRSS